MCDHSTETALLICYLATFVALIISIATRGFTNK